MYKYTEEGCFKGQLLKQPTHAIDDPAVVKMMPSVKYTTRRWLHNGCAVEELGRFPTYDVLKDSPFKSAFVYHLQDVLTNPQRIENNDNYGAIDHDKAGNPLFEPRFVIAVLADYQIRTGYGTLLEEYFGFKLLSPFFGNVKHYGNESRIGLWGLCTTRYVIEEEKKPE